MLTCDSLVKAYNNLEAAAKEAANLQEENTLHDLRRIMMTATTPRAVKWSAKVDAVIAHVRAGNYAHTDDAVRQMWNRRVY